MARLQGLDPTFQVWGIFLEDYLSLNQATQPASALVSATYERLGHHCLKSHLSSVSPVYLGSRLHE